MAHPTEFRLYWRAKLAPYPAPIRAAGFTLIELSIVLVIMGLIVGGVLVGQDLIKAAELRAVVSQKEEFATAVNTFRVKYNCIPGDCKNATTFFGAVNTSGAGGQCADPLDDLGTGTQTCNGNGDKKINYGTSNSNPHEFFRFWQHISNAELIAGDFTGVSGVTNDVDAHIPGTNSPTGSISGGGWSVWNLGPWGSTTYFEKTYKHILFFGGSGVAASQLNYQPLLLAKDVYSVDVKADDGMPGTGNIMVLWRSDCTNAASSTDYTATYLFTNEDKDCAIIFDNAF